MERTRTFGSFGLGAQLALPVWQESIAFVLCEILQTALKPKVPWHISEPMDSSIIVSALGNRVLVRLGRLAVNFARLSLQKC